MYQNGTKKFLSIVVFLLPLVVLNTAQARTFKNAYISFEMQDNWKCTLEQTEWVCKAEDPQEAKEATIIVTAKEKGEQDSFPNYANHMNTPQTSMNKAGAAMISSVKYKAQQKKINDQPWLDGLHQDSEVQYYFTRYLATIKDQIAILVTFSAHNKFYSKHSGNFNKTIQSLRVVASKDFGRQPEKNLANTEAYGGGGWGSGTGFSDNGVAEEGAASGGRKGIFKNKAVLGFLGVLLALLLYIVMKIYSKKP